MASVDPRMIEEIAKAKLAGRGPDSVQPHNPDWPPYKMYPNVYDGMDSGDYDGYLFSHPPEQEHHYGTPYAQYHGMPMAPDVPSARDLRTFSRGTDPEMRRRFEEYFGTEATNRADRGIPSSDKSYVPTPRPRPSDAPVSADDDYIGPFPEKMKPLETQGPLPEEVYSYMPGLKDRVMEQNSGEGPSRDLKRDRLDGSMWDRAMAPFADQPTGNVQDYRMMAIENMLKRGADTNPPEGSDIQPLPPMPQMSTDDMIQRQLEEWRQGQGNR